MTEPIDVLISKALLAQLVVDILNSAPILAGGGSTPVAMPLVKYTPTIGTAYADAHPILRAQPENPSIDFAGSNILRGIFQVDAVVPDSGGESPGLRIAAQIAARFPIGTKLVAGSYLLKFNKLPNFAAALKDAAWVRFPVSIPYLLITS